MADTSPPAKSPHQLAPGLAPLEYLQLTQRRGSITDPSLHASHHQLDQSPPRHPLASSFTTHRSSSYSFPSKMSDNTHANQDQPPPAPQRPWSAQHNHAQDHPMDTDQGNGAANRGSAGPDPARPNGTFLPPPPFAGGKRKMSHDRQGYYAEDHPSNGAGYPSYAAQDLDAPNPKRRGSTYDTNNRIAHLSLQDRRDSVDSRSSLSGLSMGGGGWGGDRRDSVYSTTSLASSVGSYSTAGPGEGKPYWGNSPQQPGQGGEGHPHPSSRPFAFPADPVGNGNGQQQPPSQHYSMPPAPPIPSVHYTASAAAARRLSIPESSLPLNGKPRTRGGSRAKPPVQSTSSDEGVRPPSEGGTSATSSPLAGHSVGPSSTGRGTADDIAATDSADYSQNLQLPPGSRKETPYSRSPELRVSHKMAERKRRKEMKDLFDELRDQLPADRGMKASKWEILSKAVDYISQLKVAYTDMSGEIERLRGEVDTLRPGGPPGGYTQHTLVSGPHPSSAPMAGSNPGPGPSESPSPVPHSNRNGTGNGRPSSRQSSHGGSMTDSMRSPSAPPKPLQAQHTGQSPFASHHQTPTPQQQAQPLPQSSGPQ